MERQIWEVDYYAEILDLRQENRRLRELLKEIDQLSFCPICRRNMVHRERPKHHAVCRLAKELRGE